MAHLYDYAPTVHGFPVWHDDDIIAPALLPVEVASVLREKVHREELLEEEAALALRLLCQLGIRYMWGDDLVLLAFDLSIELGQPTVYDTSYLALSLPEQCDLWTADARFAAACSGKYANVRVAGAG